MRMQRFIYGIIAALAVLVGAWWILRPAIIAVETASVILGDFTVTLEEDGRTRIRDRFTIAAPLTGRLTRISLRPGDNIRQGQSLAILQPALPPLRDPRSRKELEERVGAAEASLEEAIATQERLMITLTKSRTDLERARILRERGIISKVQIEQQDFAFEVASRDANAAERRRHAAEHALTEARAALMRTGQFDIQIAERFTITAPVSGQVLRVHHESEGVVNAGTILLEIGDPSDMEVMTDVLTADAVRILPGADVTIDRWGGDTPLRGKVRRVEPSGFTKISALGVEEQRVWTVIDLVSPPEERRTLADGFRVELSIVIERIPNATIIPASSLFRRNDGWYVFVSENARAMIRRVEIARRSGRNAAISDGISAGDRIILYPPSSLKEGIRVREVPQ